jgi:DNA-directed RNA polymerase specialized sigma24 family protein
MADDFDWENIYDELKTAARRLLRTQQYPQKSATSLVQQAWIKLARSDKSTASSDDHLRNLAVTSFRNQARTKRTLSPSCEWTRH